MSDEDRIRAFITEELNAGSDGELSNDYPLIENRVIDSMGIFELVSFVESEFGVKIDDEELVPEHFGTITRIADLVESKRVPS
jgi:acyl carrier protein